MGDEDRPGLLDLRPSSTAELRAYVVVALRAAQLSDRVHDVDAIVEDLRSRLDLDQELDDLVGSPSTMESDAEAERLP